MAFATIDEYDARFPGRTASDEMLVECLDDASAAIAQELEKRHIDPDDLTEELQDRCMRVCRSVANRLMPSGSDVPVGATQVSVTAGPYQQTASYSPTYGLPKLLPSELSMLGIGARVGWAPLGGHDD